MRNERDEKMIHAGLDVGSTTAKAVALNDQGDILFQTYRRHYSDIKKVTLEIMQDMQKKMWHDRNDIQNYGIIRISYF